MRRRSGRLIMYGVMLGVALGSMWAVVGCSSGDGGDDLVAATLVGLENQAFAFANGRAFAAALANVAVTLTFGNFTNDVDANPNTGPFTLTTAAGTARGTVTIASCNLGVEASTHSARHIPRTATRANGASTLASSTQTVVACACKMLLRVQSRLLTSPILFLH